jgi:hypothetical protein
MANPKKKLVQKIVNWPFEPGLSGFAKFMKIHLIMKNILKILKIKNL